MLDLLAAVDAYIKMATGRDWSADTTIYPEAKNAARILLTLWHENPGMINASGSLGPGLSACLGQLEAKALELESSGVPEEALKIERSGPKDGDDEMAITINPVIIFNHEMAAAATSCVVLKIASGATVASTNTLDVTAKILTIDPTASLTALTSYNIVITAAPDIYGQTITDTISFRTA
jgi:hypothetical protein